MRSQRIVQFSFLVAILALTGIVCQAAGPSPTAAFKKYHAALKNKDGVALRGMISKHDLKVLEESGMPAETLLLSAADKLPATIPETRNERIEGNTATLEYREKDKWERVHFVKEDGDWKITVGNGDDER